MIHQSFSLDWFLPFMPSKPSHYPDFLSTRLFHWIPPIPTQVVASWRPDSESTLFQMSHFLPFPPTWIFCVGPCLDNAQCADSEVRNAFERTPYVVVQKFHVFILISKSFNFRSSLERILRYLTKTWLYTLNFKKNPCWWLSIGYWVIENDSVSDTRNILFRGPWSFKIRHLWNRWPWPNIIGCLF